MSAVKRSKSTTQIVHLCDFCGKECSGHCVMCGRDACARCRIEDPFDWGDYNAKYCKPCYDMPEREALHSYRYVSDAHVEELEQEWRRAAKARVEAGDAVHTS